MPRKFSLRPRDVSLLEGFSGEEREFLRDVFVRFPEVQDNFFRYLGTSPELRLDMANEDMERILRSGWVRRGIPDPETLAEHTRNVASRALLLAPERVDRDRVAALATMHDLSEVITTDFIPRDKIKGGEKGKLERLALKVLTEGSPNQAYILGLLDEYNSKKTPEAQWVNDVDKLDSVFMALHYEAKYPERIGLHREFFDYAIPLLKTEKGREILTDLISNADRYRDEIRRNLAAQQNSLSRS